MKSKVSVETQARKQPVSEFFPSVNLSGNLKEDVWWRNNNLNIG